MNGHIAVVLGLLLSAPQDLDLQITLGHPATSWLEVESVLPGGHRVSLGLRRSVHERNTKGRSVFTSPGSTQLLLPPGWVAAPNTGGMTGLGTTHPVRDHILREQLSLGWGRRIRDDLDLSATMRHTRRDGMGVAAGTFGSTGGNARAVMLPSPVDDETTEWALTGVMVQGAHRLRANWRLSTYRNAHPALTWQNPFAGVAGWGPGSSHPDGFGSMARAPDNRAHDITVSWAWRTPGGVGLALDMAQGRHSQNEMFLPYTSNPALTVIQALPRDTLEGKLDWRRVQARIRWPIARDLDLDLRLVDDARDDRTPPALFVYVGGDALNQDAGTDGPRARWRLPRDIDRRRQDATLAWRASSSDRLALEWRYLAETREWSEVAETVEHTHALEWRRRGRLSPRLRMERSSREGTAYRDNLPFLIQHTEAYLATLDPDLVFENHPLLRRFNLADRDRRVVQGGLTATGEAWSLGVSALYRDDDYTDSMFGLTGSRQRALHADLGLHPGPRDGFTVWVAHERWSSGQSGRHFRGNFITIDLNDPNRDWHVHSRDRVDAAGLTWTRRSVVAGVDLEAGYAHTRSSVDVDTTAGPAIATAPLPTVRTMIDRFTLRASRDFSLRWRGHLGVEIDNWRSRDWAWDGVQADTMANVLGLDERPPEFARKRVTLGVSASL